MNKKIKIFLVLVLIILVILLLFIRKYYLISSILNHLNDNEKNITNYELSTNSSSIYVKDNKILLENSDTKIYVNYDNKVYFLNTSEKTYTESNNPENMITNYLNPLSALNNVSIFKLISEMKISTETLDNTKCFYIRYEDGEYWINKENYLPVQDSNGSLTTKIENIKFNFVTDEMMQLPDLSEYTLQVL
jgi:hypothetical protein